VHERTEQLEHANRELEAFSYSVSHDLRAPLRHIDGFIDLLRNQAGDALDPTSRTYLQTIASSARQMGCLIDDLLAFSRTSRGEMHAQRVDLDSMLTQVRQEVMLDNASRAIDWQIDPLPAVRGDPAMLHQMWFNLLANAAKYTRSQPAARIEVRFEGTREGLHHFVIKDNGVGFDQRFVHKLFGVFQRLHRDDEFEGTGIGLALVQRVVQRHGGSITAEGLLHVGATFRVTLPAP
jgi:light-regulated signal transduction histidine kinase (bacteriophytochrome)